MQYRRTIVTAATLNARIALALSITDACSQCAVGPVESRTPDADGCNWNLSKIVGAHCFECLEAIQEVVTDLRRRFLLGDVDGVEDRAARAAPDHRGR